MKKVNLALIISWLFNLIMLSIILGMNSYLSRDQYEFLRNDIQYHTTKSVIDHVDYVTEDYEPSCAQILKWKNYDYLPNEPRGYVVRIWGRFEPDNTHVYGTLKDAEQYIELNWCK